MLEEKHDDMMHWKNKLEELNTLPGETWDKDFAWEKLHERFYARPRNSKVYYWAGLVAACLLVILGAYWLTPEEKETSVVKTKTVKKHLPVVQNITKDTIAVSASLNSEKKILISSGTERKNKTSLPHKFLSSTMPAETDSSKLNLKQEEEINPPKDSASAIVVAVPAKKLRVVHINELGKPVEERIRLAHIPRLAQGRFNREVFSDKPVNPSDDNILKIKLFPNN